jgi:stress response protein YsnF
MRDEEVQESRQPWYEDDTLVIPVYEERLVTEKRLVLTEVIRIRRKTKTEQIEVRDTVRREVVDVESIQEPKE